MRQYCHEVNIFGKILFLACCKQLVTGKKSENRISRFFDIFESPFLTVNKNDNKSNFSACPLNYFNCLQG